MNQAATKVHKAMEWVRKHPDANEREALKAGFGATLFYKAKRRLKNGAANTPSAISPATNMQGPPPAAAAAAGNTAPPRSESNSSEPHPMTKIGRAIAFLREHPGATPEDAAKAGHSTSNYYWARRRMAGRPYIADRPPHKPRAKKTTALAARPTILAVTPSNRRILNLIMQIGLDTLVAELSNIQRSILEE